MALSSARGTITSPAGTGNQAVTGLGFQPSLVLFYCNREAAETAGADFYFMYGAAKSSSERWVGALWCGDNVATTTTSVVGKDGTKCISLPNGNSTVALVEADFVSMDADGFTINWTTASAGETIFYVALGGDEIVGVDVGAFDTGAVTGNLAVTGVGFQPDIVLFFQPRPVVIATNGYSTTSTAPQLAFGAAKSPTNRWTTAIRLADAASTVSNWVQTNMNSGRSLISFTTGAAVFTNVDLVSMDGDGFTVNRITISASAAVQFIALKLAHGCATGTETQKTSTGTKATTGLGFAPSALLLFGIGDTTDNATIQNTGEIFLGFAKNGQEFAVAANSTNAVDPTETSASSTATKAARYATGNAPTTVAEADLSSFDADGFTLNWTTADASARFMGFVALQGAVQEGIRSRAFHPGKGTTQAARFFQSARGFTPPTGNPQADVGIESNQFHPGRGVFSRARFFQSPRAFTIPGAIYNDSFSLGATGGLSLSGQLDAVGASSFNLATGLIDAGTLTVQPSISAGVTTGLTMLGGLLFNSSVALGAAVGLSESEALGAVGSVTLAATTGLGDAARLDAVGAVTIAAANDLSISPAGSIFNAAISLASAQNAAANGILITYPSLTLGETAGLVMLGGLSLGNSIGLGATLGLIDSGARIAFPTLTFGAGVGVTALAGLNLGASFALGATLGLSPSGTLVMTPSVALGAQAGLSGAGAPIIEALAALGVAVLLVPAGVVVGLEPGTIVLLDALAARLDVTLAEATALGVGDARASGAAASDAAADATTANDGAVTDLTARDGV